MDRELIKTENINKHEGLTAIFTCYIGKLQILPRFTAKPAAASRKIQ
jgi:hypothetical protein